MCAVSTIVWANDAKDRAPFLCDICKHFSDYLLVNYKQLKYCSAASHLLILVNTGVPACSLVITRRLYKITRLQRAIVSKKQVNAY